MASFAKILGDQKKDFGNVDAGSKNSIDNRLKYNIQKFKK